MRDRLGQVVGDVRHAVNLEADDGEDFNPAVHRGLVEGHQLLHRMVHFTARWCGQTDSQWIPVELLDRYKFRDMDIVRPLDVDAILQLLASGAKRPVEISNAVGDRVGAMTHSQLDHALQTAAQLKAWAPTDEALQVAGLVHDLGQLMTGVGDAEHAVAGAAAVEEALGERVAMLVGLHVEAKRYLVAKEGGYGSVLAADSVASLALQGGAMTADEMATFEQGPHFADAVRLRRADESAKVEGLPVAGLEQWMEALYRVRRHAG